MARSKTTPIQIPDSERLAEIVASIIGRCVLKTDDGHIRESEAWEYAKAHHLQPSAARDHIAAARLTSAELPFFNRTLRESLTALEEAQKAKQRAEALFQDGVALQTQWTAMVRELQKLAEAIDAARAGVKCAKDGRARALEESHSRTLNPSSVGFARAAAEAAAKHERAIPILEENLRTVESAAREHLRSMREFAAEHDLSPLLLRELFEDA